MPIPLKFKNPPYLWPGLELYFQAYEELISFLRLNPERPVLLWADVHEYAKHHNFTPDQHDDLIYYAAELEGVYQTWFRKKNSGKNLQTTKPKTVRTK